MPAPYKKIREKGIEITLWEQTGKDELIATLRKSYKDKTTEEWKETSRYFAGDLEGLIKVATAARKEIHDYAERRKGNPTKESDEDVPW